jgi:hypothetical protein
MKIHFNTDTTHTHTHNTMNDEHTEENNQQQFIHRSQNTDQFAFYTMSFFGGAPQQPAGPSPLFLAKLDLTMYSEMFGK